MSKCQFIKSNNKQCQAMALKGQDFCYFHSKDKSIIKKRNLSSSKGGSKGKIETDGLFQESFQLETVEQINNLLEFTTNNLLQGKISREKASCIGYLSNIMIGAKKRSGLTKRSSNSVKAKKESNEKPILQKYLEMSEKELLDKIKEAHEALTNTGKYSVPKFTGEDLSKQNSSNPF